MPVCLLPQTGKGCVIQDMQAVTQSNFCGNGTTAAAQPGSSGNTAMPPPPPPPGRRTAEVDDVDDPEDDVDYEEPDHSHHDDGDDDHGESQSSWGSNECAHAQTINRQLQERMPTLTFEEYA